MKIRFVALVLLIAVQRAHECLRKLHGVNDFRFRRRISASSAAFLLGTMASRGSPYYHVVDLGSLGGSDANGYEVAYPKAINNHGQVVGYAYTASGEQHAFFYSGSTMGDLNPQTASDGIANDINDSGTVVGSVTYTTSGATHAFKYESGGFIDLNDISGDTNASSADAINASGQIVGHDQNANSVFTSYLMTTAPWLSLGALASNFGFGPSRLNAAGQIIGSATTDGENSHMTLATVNRGIATLTDLDPLIESSALPGTSYGSSYGAAINDSGEIAGAIGDYDGYHRAIYAKLQNGSLTWTELGVLPLGNYYDPTESQTSDAEAINASGQIVGVSWHTYDYDKTKQVWFFSPLYHAFFATVTNGVPTMVDLNSRIPFEPGWVLERAIGVNDSGQIACSALGTDGLRHAVLLNPTTDISPQTPTPTPTPASTPASGLSKQLHTLQKQLAAAKKIKNPVLRKKKIKQIQRKIASLKKRIASQS